MKNSNIVALQGALKDAADVLEALLKIERESVDSEQYESAKKATDEAVKIQLAAVENIVKELDPEDD